MHVLIVLPKREKKEKKWKIKLKMLKNELLDNIN